METMLKPKYQVDLVVERRSHFYRVNLPSGEILLPGVTGVLSIISKPALVPWAKKVALESVRKELMDIGPEPKIMEPDFIDSIIAGAKKRPDEEKDKAADYGTRLHEYADKVIKGTFPGDVDDDLKNSVLAFKDWLSSGVEIVAGDTPVASVENGYGGKFDAVAKKNGEYGIIDIKTSNACYDEYALQVAAYAKAAEETYGVPFTWAAIVRFGKTSPDYEVKNVANIAKAFEAFIAAKRLRDTLADGLFL